MYSTNTIEQAAESTNSIAVDVAEMLAANQVHDAERVAICAATIAAKLFETATVLGGVSEIEAAAELEALALASLATLGHLLGAIDARSGAAIHAAALLRDGVRLADGVAELAGRLDAQTCSVVVQ